MLKEYKQVNENGYVVESYVFDDEIEKIPDGYKETWNPLTERFFKPRYDFVNNRWVEGLAQEDIHFHRYGTIDVHKKAKDAELNKACSDAILGGFDFAMDGVTYHFSYDNEAQVNFQETYALFQNSVINDVMWTVTLGEGKFRLFLNKDRFTQVYYASIQHKLRCIKYYRDKLTPLLTSATTYDMINNIVWDSSVYEDVAISTNTTIDNKIEALASESQMTMMALIELSGMVMA